MNFAKFLRIHYLQNTSGRLLLVLFVASFLNFPLLKIFASKSRFVLKKSTSGNPALGILLDLKIQKQLLQQSCS